MGVPPHAGGVASVLRTVRLASTRLSTMDVAGSAGGSAGGGEEGPQMAQVRQSQRAQCAVHCAVAHT